MSLRRFAASTLLTIVLIVGFSTFTSASDGSLKNQVKQNLQVTEVNSEITVDAELVEAIRELYPDDSNGKYYYNYVDLNNDDDTEVIVLYSSLAWCGSCGCPTSIFERQPQGYRHLQSISCTYGSVITVLNSYTNGWRDLVHPSREGYVINRFNGTSYANSPGGSTPLSSNVTILGTSYLSDVRSSEGLPIASSVQREAPEQISESPTDQTLLTGAVTITPNSLNEELEALYEELQQIEEELDRLEKKHKNSASVP